MRVSDFYSLGRTQSTLDFVDVDLETDVPVFLSPSALVELQSPWANACASMVQDFFQHILNLIQSGRNSEAVKLLSQLKEPNETRLGLSRGKPNGHAVGEQSAVNLWQSLSESEAAASGLLQDLEDTVLLVKGIRTDIISDITTNIIRGPLIAYTQGACEYYNIPLVDDVDSGPVWNTTKKQWENGFVRLPSAGKYGKLLLVPKSIVRLTIGFDASEYYRHYLLERMISEAEQANSAMVRLIQSGPRAGEYGITKTAMIEQLGQDKDTILAQTKKYPDVLDSYRLAKSNERFLPMSHDQFAEVENSPLPDWNDLLQKVVSTPIGRECAHRYEDAIEALLTALFYPALTYPTKQSRIHNGRKIIDISYSNMGVAGFFRWAQLNYPAANIFVECKNYSADVGNPELDQLAGRFSPSRGKIGLLVSRDASDKKLMMQRCIDTAKDDRGYIIPLFDSDLATLVREKEKDRTSLVFNLLRSRFRQLTN